MTVREAIDRLDGLKPNQYTEEDKLRWLSELDMGVFMDVILTHEHESDLPMFEGYTAEDYDKKLIVDEPFTEMYTAYLKMKIDEENGETARYNNSAVLFNAYYDNYAKHYNRTHMPLRKTNFKWW